MKQYHRYQMKFDGKAMWLSGICMGIPVFALTIYYLFLHDFTQVTLGTKVLNFWIPIGLCLVYIILHRLVRLNAPGVYAIIGAVFCLLQIIGLFTTGNVLRIVLGLLGYLLSGAVLILSAGGYLPGRLPAALCFAVVLLVRLLFFDLGKISGMAWLPELSSLAMITGLMFLPISMIPGKKKELS